MSYNERFGIDNIRRRLDAERASRRGKTINKYQRVGGTSYTPIRQPNKSGVDNLDRSLRREAERYGGGLASADFQSREDSDRRINQLIERIREDDVEGNKNGAKEHLYVLARTIARMPKEEIPRVMGKLNTRGENLFDALSPRRRAKIAVELMRGRLQGDRREQFIDQAINDYLQSGPGMRPQDVVSGSRAYDAGLYDPTPTDPGAEPTLDYEKFKTRRPGEAGASVSRQRIKKDLDRNLNFQADVGQQAGLDLVGGAEGDIARQSRLTADVGQTALELQQQIGAPPTEAEALAGVVAKRILPALGTTEAQQRRELEQGEVIVGEYIRDWADISTTLRSANFGGEDYDEDPNVKDSIDTMESLASVAELTPEREEELTLEIQKQENAYEMVKKYGPRAETQVEVLDTIGQIESFRRLFRTAHQTEQTLQALGRPNVAGFSAPYSINVGGPDDPEGPGAMGMFFATAKLDVSDEAKKKSGYVVRSPEGRIYVNDGGVPKRNAEGGYEYTADPEMGIPAETQEHQYPLGKWLPSYVDNFYDSKGMPSIVDISKASIGDAEFQNLYGYRQVGFPVGTFGFGAFTDEGRIFPKLPEQPVGVERVERTIQRPLGQVSAEEIEATGGYDIEEEQELVGQEQIGRYEQTGLPTRNVLPGGRSELTGFKHPIVGGRTLYTDYNAEMDEWRKEGEQTRRKPLVLMTFSGEGANGLLQNHLIQVDDIPTQVVSLPMEKGPPLQQAVASVVKTYIGSHPVYWGHTVPVPDAGITPPEIFNNGLVAVNSILNPLLEGGGGPLVDTRPLRTDDYIGSLQRNSGRGGGYVEFTQPTKVVNSLNGYLRQRDLGAGKLPNPEKPKDVGAIGGGQIPQVEPAGPRPLGDYKPKARREIFDKENPGGLFGFLTGERMERLVSQFAKYDVEEEKIKNNPKTDKLKLRTAINSILTELEGTPYDTIDKARDFLKKYLDKEVAPTKDTVILRKPTAEEASAQQIRGAQWNPQTLQFEPALIERGEVEYKNLNLTERGPELYENKAYTMGANLGFYPEEELKVEMGKIEGRAQDFIVEDMVVQTATGPLPFKAIELQQTRQSLPDFVKDVPLEFVEDPTGIGLTINAIDTRTEKPIYSKQDIEDIIEVSKGMPNSAGPKGPRPVYDLKQIFVSKGKEVSDERKKGTMIINPALVQLEQEIPVPGTDRTARPIDFIQPGTKKKFKGVIPKLETNVARNPQVEILDELINERAEIQSTSLGVVLPQDGGGARFLKTVRPADIFGATAQDAEADKGRFTEAKKQLDADILASPLGQQRQQLQQQIKSAPKDQRKELNKRKETLNKAIDQAFAGRQGDLEKLKTAQKKAGVSVNRQGRAVLGGRTTTRKGTETSQRLTMAQVKANLRAQQRLAFMSSSFPVGAKRIHLQED